MGLFWALSASFFCGYVMAWWHLPRRYRRIWHTSLIRRWQNKWLQIEVARMRHAQVAARSRGKRTVPPWKVRLKKIRPQWSCLHKLMLGMVHRWYPRVTSVLSVGPNTLVGWGKRWQKIFWTRLIQHGKKRRKMKPRGRPPEYSHLFDVIRCIKETDPSYGHVRIANIITRELGEKVSADTVLRILKKLGLNSRPGKQDKRRQEQTWREFLNKHNVSSMDFKTVFDIHIQPMYVLNIMDHVRRVLVYSACTYHPTAEWVAQVLREAFPFDTAPKYMVLDRDSIFIPIVHRVLPSMGITVRRIGLKCPWQNGVVERFHRTMQEELLDYVIPIGEAHLSRLLKEYREFYNTARPHMKLDGESPESAPVPAHQPATVHELPDGRRLEAVSWIGGLHHSYRWAV